MRQEILIKQLPTEKKPLNLHMALNIKKIPTIDWLNITQRISNI